MIISLHGDACMTRPTNIHRIKAIRTAGTDFYLPSRLPLNG